MALVIDKGYYSLGTIKDRIPFIISYVRGKKVLDLGCIKHDLRSIESPYWLHGIIKKYARSLTGVDYLPEVADELNKLGYSVVNANVESMRLGERFDVIVAGGLIEHLENPGLFLERVYDHLEDGGVVIITTPNAFSFRHLLRSLFFGCVPTNKEHTCWYCVKTLSFLMERKGFEEVEYLYYFDSPQSWKYYIEAFAAFFRSSYAPSLIYVGRKGVRR